DGPSSRDQRRGRGTPGAKPHVDWFSGSRYTIANRERTSGHALALVVRSAPLVAREVDEGIHPFAPERGLRKGQRGGRAENIGSPPSCYRGSEGSHARRPRVEPCSCSSALRRTAAAANRRDAAAASAPNARSRRRHGRWPRLFELQARAGILVEATRRGAL